MEAERLVRIGMLAAIRDMQEFIQVNAWNDTVPVGDIDSYLLAMLITADGYEAS